MKRMELVEKEMIAVVVKREKWKGRGQESGDVFVAKRLDGGRGMEGVR